MLNKSVEAAINDQIAQEFYASHVYLSMAAWLETQSLVGFAKWMRLQADEERVHAMRLFDFVLNNGGEVQLQGIDQPPTTFKSPLAVMEMSLEHERGVTATITRIYELTLKEKDYPAQLEMQWFIDEQSEEERVVGDIIARMKIGGDSGTALLLLDGELGGRPAASGGGE